ncbi:hypothetical protein [Burkholderia dolosa]|uniref:hypothetical protein n=1 Tax=Burkholderia dolosa TaxID=152500 RepID=UPI001B9D2F5B|nr:hypothetical protein [Burkholderia dolosa]MBR8058425.1 hypothetical protein [Burkholderia dolosa]
MAPNAVVTITDYTNYLDHEAQPIGNVSGTITRGGMDQSQIGGSARLAFDPDGYLQQLPPFTDNVNEGNFNFRIANSYTDDGQNGDPVTCKVTVIYDDTGDQSKPVEIKVYPGRIPPKK